MSIWVRFLETLPKEAYMQKKDTLFGESTQGVQKKFEFDTQVASVFDDMLERSIPFYRESLALCIDFLKYNAKDGVIYDLGCSTGNLLLNLEPHTNATLIGLDTSKAMIEHATLKAKAYNASISFKVSDCTQEDFCESSAFVSNYTLQFIRPPQRLGLVRKIYQSLRENGIFIMSEKMTTTDPLLDSQMIEYYHSYKHSNGYSKTQIARKREALENVLIPYTLQENLHLLQEAGFKHTEVLFKWVNFGMLIARK